MNFLKLREKILISKNVNVLQNNPLAGLLTDYVFNQHDQIEFQIEPTQLFVNLRSYAIGKQIDIIHGRWFPQNAEWLSRKIRTLKEDFKAANILVDPDIREYQKRWIYFKKITTHNASIDEYKN